MEGLDESKGHLSYVRKVSLPELSAINKARAAASKPHHSFYDPRPPIEATHPGKKRKPRAKSPSKEPAPVVIVRPDHYEKGTVVTKLSEKECRNVFTKIGSQFTTIANRGDQGVGAVKPIKICKDGPRGDFVVNSEELREGLMLFNTMVNANPGSSSARELDSTGLFRGFPEVATPPRNQVATPRASAGTARGPCPPPPRTAGAGERGRGTSSIEHTLKSAPSFRRGESRGGPAGQSRASTAGHGGEGGRGEGAAPRPKKASSMFGRGGSLNRMVGDKVTKVVASGSLPGAPESDVVQVHPAHAHSGDVSFRWDNGPIRWDNGPLRAAGDIMDAYFGAEVARSLRERHKWPSSLSSRSEGQPSSRVDALHLGWWLSGRLRGLGAALEDPPAAGAGGGGGGGGGDATGGEGAGEEGGPTDARKLRESSKEIAELLDMAELEGCQQVAAHCIERGEVMILIWRRRMELLRSSEEDARAEIAALKKERDACEAKYQVAAHRLDAAYADIELMDFELEAQQELLEDMTTARGMGPAGFKLKQLPSNKVTLAREIEDRIKAKRDARGMPDVGEDGHIPSRPRRSSEVAPPAHAPGKKVESWASNLRETAQDGRTSDVQPDLAGASFLERPSVDGDPVTLLNAPAPTDGKPKSSIQQLIAKVETGGDAGSTGATRSQDRRLLRRRLSQDSSGGAREKWVEKEDLDLLMSMEQNEMQKSMEKMVPEAQSEALANFQIRVISKTLIYLVTKGGIEVAKHVLRVTPPGSKVAAVIFLMLEPIAGRQAMVGYPERKMAGLINDLLGDGDVAAAAQLIGMLDPDRMGPILGRLPDHILANLVRGMNDIEEDGGSPIVAALDLHNPEVAMSIRRVLGLAQPSSESLVESAQKVLKSASVTLMRIGNNSPLKVHKDVVAESTKQGWARAATVVQMTKMQGDMDRLRKLRDMVIDVQRLPAAEAAAVILSLPSDDVSPMLRIMEAEQVAEILPHLGVEEAANGLASLNPAKQAAIVSHMHSRALTRVLAGMRSKAAAVIFDSLSHSKQVYALQHLPLPAAASILGAFSAMERHAALDLVPEEHQASLLAALPPEAAAATAETMPYDRAARLFAMTTPAVANRILVALGEISPAALDSLVEHDGYSGAVAMARVVGASDADKARKILEHMKLETRAAVAAQTSIEGLISILGELSVDDKVDLLTSLPQRRAGEYLHALPAREVLSVVSASSAVASIGLWRLPRQWAASVVTEAMKPPGWEEDADPLDSAAGFQILEDMLWGDDRQSQVDDLVGSMDLSALVAGINDDEGRRWEVAGEVVAAMPPKELAALVRFALGTSLGGAAIAAATVRADAAATLPAIVAGGADGGVEVLCHLVEHSPQVLVDAITSQEVPKLGAQVMTSLEARPGARGGLLRALPMKTALEVLAHLASKVSIDAAFLALKDLPESLAHHIMCSLETSPGQEELHQALLEAGVPHPGSLASGGPGPLLAVEDLFLHVADPLRVALMVAGCRVALRDHLEGLLAKFQLESCAAADASDAPPAAIGLERVAEMLRALGHRVKPNKLESFFCAALWRRSEAVAKAKISTRKSQGVRKRSSITLPPPPSISIGSRGQGAEQQPGSPSAPGTPRTPVLRSKSIKKLESSKSAKSLAGAPSRRRSSAGLEEEDTGGMLLGFQTAHQLGEFLVRVAVLLYPELEPHEAARGLLSSFCALQPPALAAAPLAPREEEVAHAAREGSELGNKLFETFDALAGPAEPPVPGLEGAPSRRYLSGGQWLGLCSQLKLVGGKAGMSMPDARACFVLSVNRFEETFEEWGGDEEEGERGPEWTISSAFGGQQWARSTARRETEGNGFVLTRAEFACALAIAGRMLYGKELSAESALQTLAEKNIKD